MSKEFGSFVLVNISSGDAKNKNKTPDGTITKETLVPRIYIDFI